MTLRYLHIIIQLCVFYYFPATATQIVFQCHGNTSITDNFKLGTMFGTNYCLAYGEILSTAIDALDIDDNDDENYDDFCQCIPANIKCTNHSNTQSCLGDQTYCCDPDHFELFNQEKDVTIEDLKTEEDYGKCWSRILNVSSVITEPWRITLKSYSYRSKKTETKCDAVIVHPSVILTDSSCFSGKEKLFIADIDQKRGLELIREKKVYKYLTLVRLKTALNFTKTTRSVCLPFAPINLNHSCTLITSLGTEIIPEILNTTACRNGLSSSDQRKGKHMHTICSTSASNRKCQNDSNTRLPGGPLFCELSGRDGHEFALAGIVPKMFRCNGLQPLEYFSDLKSALNWISQTFTEWDLDVISFTP